MWLTTPSADSLARARIIAVAVISVVVAGSAGYYAYREHREGTSRTSSAAPSLRRRNAVRRSRRGDDEASSDEPGDENVDASESQAAGPGEPDLTPAGDDWSAENPNPNLQPQLRTGHNIVGLLFRVSEDNAHRNGRVHRGCQCNSCGMVPICGIRYRCANCADFDLCETCEAQDVHIRTHIFYKIQVPAPPFGPRQIQPVWYTGDATPVHRTLPRGLVSRLSLETGYERPELEAYWEQWTYMACTEWPDDPDSLGLAMDRKTFDRCLVPTGGSRHAAPNLIHDRMFSFYDYNHDDLIGFSEFLRGLSYRRRRDKLIKIFEGYDIDGDGYVDRRDFLRMFRAYYVLYKQMHKDILDGLEDQLMAGTDVQQLIHTRQPLSSHFSREGPLPPGDTSFRFEGKRPRLDGSIDVADARAPVFTDSKADVTSRGDILTSLFACDGGMPLIGRHDAASDGRTFRHLRRSSLDPARFTLLLDVPSSLEGIPAALAAADDQRFRADDATDGEGESEVETEIADNIILTYDESRVRAAARMRHQAPRLERQRRDMARKKLHDRWMRRHFYLDEEEGGEPPQDWTDDEDILAGINWMMQDSKPPETCPSTTRSRSSSKVRFAEDTDEFEVKSNFSSSSRSVPERWGSMEIPDAERDAGREILYQVTQQAFNELLDTLFKHLENEAVAAAETASIRERFRDQIDAVDLTMPFPDGLPEPEVVPIEKEAKDKDLGELLADAGYGLVADEPRSAIDLESPVEVVHKEQIVDGEDADEDDADDDDEDDDDADEDAEGEDEFPSADDDDANENHYEEHTTSEASRAERRDPTLPQHRPNTEAEADAAAAAALSEEYVEEPSSPFLSEPIRAETLSAATLRRWKALTIAEARAQERGGWGRLSFSEFEDIYKAQENMGNRLDYLGSWIDFCIP